MLKPFLLVLVLASLMLVGCARPEDENSRIQIRVPKAGEGPRSKLGALSATWPPDNQLCFAVVVTGPGIPLRDPPKSSCPIQLGARAGFLPVGATMEVSVPRGEKRRFDLYAYLKDPRGSCPTLNGTLGVPSHTTRIFHVGRVEDKDIQGASEVVNIHAEFPGFSQHIGQRLAWPSECIESQDLISSLNTARLLLGQQVLKQSEGTVELRVYPQGRRPVFELQGD